MDLYSVTCGNGELAISQMPGRTNGYAKDMKVILQWSPDLVLSMTTFDEMAEFGSQDVSKDLTKAGVAWIHLPIEDFGVPEKSIKEIWPETSKRALMILNNKGRVLIHCLGGQGRSGMAALRLLIESGMQAEKALADLRSVRPKAVETDAQMIWATNGQIKRK